MPEGHDQESTQPVSSEASGPDDLCQKVVEATLAVPGVLRIEPSFVGRLGTTLRGIASRSRSFDVPGLKLTQDSQGGGMYSVSVDLAVDAAQSTRKTVRLVQQGIEQVLRDNGHRVAEVAVSVLTVERA